MADFGATQLDATTQEIWDQKVEDARYDNAVIVKAVSHKSEAGKKKTDKIHVSIDQRYDIVTVDSAGVFVPTNYTVSTVAIDIDQHEAVPIQILDKAAAQSFWTPESSFPTNAGKRIGERYDERLAGLHGDVAAGNIVGSTTEPVSFGLSQAREAMFKAIDARVPMENLSFVIHPLSYYGGLYSEKQLTAANESGSAKNKLISGQIDMLLNTPVFQTKQIVTVGSVKKNLLLHKSSMAIAWSKDNEFERARSTANLTLATLLVTQTIYGFKVIRSDHFVTINSAAVGTF